MNGELTQIDESDSKVETSLSPISYNDALNKLV